MSTYRSIGRYIGAWLVGASMAALQISVARAQVAPEVARLGYADSIFFNGKIVSMDDRSSSTQVGRIYQALAVKGDKIMKLGTNEDVKAVSGPDTKMLDLKGRVMLPGIVEPHSHPYGGVFRYASRFGYKIPPDGIEVEATADRSLEKTQAIVRDTIKEAIKKVKPGEWVVLYLKPNPEAPAESSLWGYTRRLSNRQTLDSWAPDNPVVLDPIAGNQLGFSGRGWINSKALAILNDLLPGYSASIQETMHGVVIGEDIAKIGWVGSQEMDAINWELFLQRMPATTLAQALKLTSEELAVTATLAAIGQMPVRLDAHYEVHRMPTEPSQTRQMYRRTGVLQGIGNDYFWIDGVASERWDSIYPESCTGPDTKAPPNIKSRETCPKPGDLHWDTLENAMKAGWRLAGVPSRLR